MNSDSGNSDSEIPPRTLSPRYEELGFLGRGGVGEVLRVRDRRLFRNVALKVLQPGVVQDGTVATRFIDEAQVTAQLEHPGIVPVHDIGQLTDGRRFFTMKEVRGRTLQDVIREAHRSEVAFPLRRLVDVFLRACEAVAYAHARGVIHRDLKPQNVMVGEYGEVLVLDWGLAKVISPEGGVIQAKGAASPSSGPVLTSSSEVGAQVTQVGQVAGTLAYMPLEQALGELERIGPATDVYSLGAVLYEILAGEAAYSVLHLRDLLRFFYTEQLTPPSELCRKRIGEGARLGQPFVIPGELEAICIKAMSREPGDRYPDARALGAAVGAWLEGASKRERALEILVGADDLLPEIADLERRAASLRVDAARLLAGVRAADPAEAKEPAWALEDEADRLDREAQTVEVAYLSRLREALSQASDLPEALARMADRFRQEHVKAEARRDPLGAVRYEALLRAHDQGAHAAYLEGDGSLTLITEPAGAEVVLFRHVERGRRLVLERVHSLGPTPLHDVPLPMGSYLLEIRSEGRATLRYPVSIGRQACWDPVRPGDRAGTPLYLPRAEELGEGEIYVPAGPFRSGGDARASAALPARRLWCDGFVIGQSSVTNREYLRFLDDLVRQGREEEALRCVPRERAAREGERGALIYGRTPEGGFFLAKDAEGNAWPPGHPVLMIDWFSAAAYARWLAQSTGLPWRLAGEWEWEKAARGVDGRFFPWGDFLDPTWCCIQDSHVGRPLPAAVDAHPIDTSPYGVRGLGGNVRDWCFDRFRKEGAPVTDDGIVCAPGPVPDGPPDAAHRVLRGGAWILPATDARSASRGACAPSYLFPVIGFRIARSLG